MAKVAQPTAWDWLCRLARSQAMDPVVVSLADAAQHLLATLENCHAHGRPLPASPRRRSA